MKGESVAIFTQTIVLKPITGVLEIDPKFQNADLGILCSACLRQYYDQDPMLLELLGLGVLKTEAL